MTGVIGRVNGEKRRFYGEATILAAGDYGWSKEKRINNQIGIRMRDGEADETLLIQAYTAAQHYNWMEDPFSGKIAIPDDESIDEPSAFGQGAEQGKAHFAAMLTLLKAFEDSGTQIDGTFYFVANNEARSSHDCTRSILPELDHRPDHGLLLYNGGNSIMIGNRGRVDILVHIDGEVAHSSDPQSGQNAIMGANKAINRIYGRGTN